MTHPLTPREKVQPFERYPALASWIAKMASVGNGLSLGEWMTFVGTLNSAIVQAEQRTALASGSGDHAELARLAEAASGSDWQTYISGRPEYKNVTHYVEQNPPRDLPFIAEVQEERDAAFIAAANPATVLALLAENAALRESISRHDRQVSGMLRARLSAETRATEAERKLAEAMGLLRGLADYTENLGENLERNDLDMHLDACERPLSAVQPARTFLSKEAERG